MNPTKILYRPDAQDFLVQYESGAYSWPADRIAERAEIPAAAVQESRDNPEKWIAILPEAR